MRMYAKAACAAAIALSGLIAGPVQAATYDVTGTFSLSAKTSITGEGTATPQRARTSAMVDGFDSTLGTLDSVTVVLDYRQDALTEFWRQDAPDGSFASGASGFQGRIAGEQVPPTRLSRFTKGGEEGGGSHFVRSLTFSGDRLDPFLADSLKLDFIALAAVRLVCGESGACGASSASTSTATAGNWLVRYDYSVDGERIGATVPLPPSLMLLPIGLAALGFAGRRRSA